ncbi:hypothetical protein [Streptomyces sp. NBC_00847]|uniref:hypothetical protein n=1 Tax=Streptomyces sp. NBC_00847 TaxID=2975850 RepID=UPI00225E5186|nr:hypothetical protein [Streptomyces sp. NBC_00847]MCX4885887.1 hypothetical protein [Streptomyces sp. NBC_00847]
MATTTTGPQHPITDTEARMRVFQIIGSDIPPGTAAYTGDWHQALRATASHWAPTRRQRITRRIRRALHLAA